MALDVKIRQKALGAYVISCTGRMDSETSPLLEKEVRGLIAQKPGLLALDLEHLVYMSSAGVRVLIIAHKGMKDAGGKVVLLNVQPQVKKVLEIIQALPEQKIFRDMVELDAYLDRMQKKVIEND